MACTRDYRRRRANRNGVVFAVEMAKQDALATENASWLPTRGSNPDLGLQRPSFRIQKPELPGSIRFDIRQLRRRGKSHRGMRDGRAPEAGLRHLTAPHPRVMPLAGNRPRRDSHGVAGQG